MKELQNYIAGAWHKPVNDMWLDNPEPATGKVYSRLPDSTKEDVQMAVDAAKSAFPIWSQ
ncbi:MAG: aldehyde dehydrogenase family protein, partial [Candidatus Kapaibacteriota bacterium]